MNLVDFVIRFRTQIFIILIFFEIISSFGAYFNRTSTTKMFFVIETLVTLGIIILSFILLDKFNLFSYLANKRRSILNSSPSSYIAYDINEASVSASLAAINLLNIEKKDKYQLADISELFLNAEWREIEKIINEPTSYIHIEKNGELKINDKEGYQSFVKYRVQVVRERELDLFVVIFWFFDFTETKMIQEEFQNYLSKYREISFSQDLLLSNLNIPVCYYNKDKDFIIYNDLFVQVFDYKADTKEISSKLKKEIKDLKNNSNIKSQLLKQHFEISKIKLENNIGEIIIANDSSHSYNLNKEIKILSESFNEIVELSKNSIMLINEDGIITNFNDKIIKTFDLDKKWLKERPSFAEFIDMLKSKNKIPESLDFLEYKKNILRHLIDNKSSYVDFFHQTGGVTQKISLIPSKTGGKIYVCEDITDVLSIERSYNEIRQVMSEIISIFNFPVIIVGYDGNIKQFNNNTLLFFKIENEEELNNAHYSKFINLICVNDNECKKINNIFASCLENRLSENTCITPNKEDLKVKVTSLPDNSILVSFTNP